MTTEALERAVEICGGQRALADKIGTSQQQVWYWLRKNGRGLPAEYVLTVERVTGISRHILRPDLYPPPEPSPPGGP